MRVILVLLLWAACAASFDTTTETIQVGTRKQLFIDRKFIQNDTGVTLKMNPPVKAGIALAPDRPWEQGWLTGSGYVSEDGGRYRMWYVVIPPARRIGEAPGLLCYAESDDGRAWRKPNLGLYDYNGSKANNIVMPGMVESNVFIDPSAPETERYKFVAILRKRHGFTPPEGDGMYVYLSADGLRWRLHPTRVFPFFPDTVNHALYDTRLNKYVIYVRTWNPMRKIGRVETADILKPWPYDQSGPPAKISGVPGQQVPTAFGYDAEDPPQSDHYTSAAVQYPWAQDAYFMFPSPYLHFPEPPKGRLRNEGLLDIQMAVSRDGLSYTRVERWPYIECGLDGSLDSRQLYMITGMIRAGNEIYQYYSGYPFTHGGYQGIDESWLRKLGTMFRVVQRPDGFVSAEAPMSGGSFTTPPLKFEGTRLALNMNASAMGEVRLELREPDGKPIEGFRFEDCDPVHGNYLERIVTWKGQPQLTSLAARPVRIAFQLRAVKLYAFQFVK